MSFDSAMGHKHGGVGYHRWPLFAGSVSKLPIALLAVLPMVCGIGRAEIFTVNQTVTLDPTGITSSYGEAYYILSFGDVSPVTVQAGDEITGTITFINGPILLTDSGGSSEDYVELYFDPSPPAASLADNFSLNFQGLAGTFPGSNPATGSAAGSCCLFAFQDSGFTASDFSFTGLTYTIDVTSVSTGTASVYFSEFLLGAQTIEFGAAIPEPSTLALCGLGCLALAWGIRRRSVLKSFQQGRF